MTKLIKCWRGHFNNTGTPICWCGATTYEGDIELPLHETSPLKATMAETPQLEPDVQNPVQENVQTALITLEKQNEILLRWLSQIMVTNCDERKSCSDMLTNARTALKEAKEKLAELTLPAKKEIGDINSKFKPFIEQIDTGIKSITIAISKWDFEQAILAREVNIETGELSNLPAPPATTQNNFGSDTKVSGFDIVIDNPCEVERIYCDPSMVKLRAGFKIYDQIKGAHKIPKIIYQTRHK
jgi:hypothetical protein